MTKDEYNEAKAWLAEFNATMNAQNSYIVIKPELWQEILDFKEHLERSVQIYEQGILSKDYIDWILALEKHEGYYSYGIVEEQIRKQKREHGES